MKIAVMSDTHNNRGDLMLVLKALKAQGVKTVIHCGDMTSASTAELFEGFIVHHVRGNGDLDALGIEYTLASVAPGSTSDDVYTDLIDGKRIAVLHGHRMGMFYSLLESGRFDYLFHGHTHRRRDEMDGSTRIINPGAIGGAHRGVRGYAIVDFAVNDVAFHTLEPDL